MGRSALWDRLPIQPALEGIDVGDFEEQQRLKVLTEANHAIALNVVHRERRLAGYGRASGIGVS